MARNTSITLGDHFETFVDERISAGRFSSASEVVRAGLRLLEEHENKVEVLREAIIEGMNSGVCELSVSELLAEAKAEFDGQAL